VERFLALRDSVFRNPESYFHRFAQLTHEDAVAMAQGVWREINGLNLRENILPTRDRATLILEKAADHRVRRVRLRKL
jgi:type I pantothenate kinase